MSDAYYRRGTRLHSKEEQLDPVTGERLPEREPERKHAVKLEDIGENGEIDREREDGSSRSESYSSGKKLGTSRKMNAEARAQREAENGEAKQGKKEEEHDRLGLWHIDKMFADLRKRKNMTPAELEQEAEMKKYVDHERQDPIAYAMDVVSKKTVNEQGLRNRLWSRGYSEKETEEAIRYVKSYGYVKDSRLAQDMLERLAARCWGKYKICKYLLSRGFMLETVEHLDMSEIDFPFYCAKLIMKYPPERSGAMLRAVRNAGYTLSDYRRARELIEGTRED